MAKDFPTISIVIPTWNTVDITLRCIQTIQKFLPIDSIQIIIVDNGSSDSTSSKISKIKNVTYIQNPSNFGFSKANNIGAQHASGKYLLFLNSDMELINDSLLSMTDYLQKNPQIGAIGPAFLNPDLSLQGSVMNDQTPINAIKEYWLGSSNSYSKYAPTTNIPIAVENISGGAVLINHNLFNKIGGWNEKYFFYFEDLDLCRQIRRDHKSVYYYPQCHVIHRHGASGKTVKDDRNQWRRLIPSSIKFHGYFEHYLIFFITWSNQKWHQLRQLIGK